MIPCSMQRGELVSESWCERCQQRDLCRGCGRNKGRERSRYQEEKDGREIFSDGD